MPLQQLLHAAAVIDRSQESTHWKQRLYLAMENMPKGVAVAENLLKTDRLGEMQREFSHGG